ncbi:DUF3231 family protein [Paenibacillus wynnii]|uniref:Uncharacterized protein n=1 Tax=Paenibacillus wynnii TaxID=268407 RepID=A0A098MF98_9BACL|nr:DUF3231 family protein [Paenibacillus wynnii]KGE20713.1 hypothetical protein PWYN_00565 [Paenibacillus wynnii]
MEIKKLTPAETASLWSSYLTNSMAMWVTRYFIGKTQDKELHDILKYAEEIATIETEKSKAFLENANHPLPQKFDNSDVDLNAPAICTDNFTLLIKLGLVQAAQVVYSMALNTSIRKDIRLFYQECQKNTTELFIRLSDLSIKKGLNLPDLHIPIPNHVEKVSKQSFLAGWFADRRPINAIEIALLEFNFRSTEFHKTFLKSFAQITNTPELKEHFVRGADIYEKHLEIFQSILTENDLPKLPTWESELTDTTISPFSERLMLFKMSLLVASSSGQYGSSLSSIQRRDLGVHFMRLMAETLKYGEDSINLMIDYGFLDQLPMAKENPTVPTSM